MLKSIVDEKDKKQSKLKGWVHKYTAAAAEQQQKMSKDSSRSVNGQGRSILDCEFQ